VTLAQTREMPIAITVPGKLTLNDEFGSWIAPVGWVVASDDARSGGQRQTWVVSRTGVLRSLAAAILFGASAPAASVLARDMPALTLAGLLYLGAAMAVAPVVVCHPPRVAAMRAGWKPVAVAVVAGGALGPALLVAGLARIDAATASILLNLELVATIVLAATLFREHLGRRVLGGAALVATAGALLVWEPGAALDVGALLIVAACACWGLDNCVTARIEQLSPESVVLAKGAMAGSVNLALGLTLAARSGGSVTAGQVVGALAIGAAAYGLSITLWVKGARDLGAARAQVIFATAPFIGAAIAWVALEDPVTAVQLVAVVLAAAGVTLSIDSAHEHRHRHEPTVHDHEHVHPDAHHDHDHAVEGPDDVFVGRHSHLHAHDDVLVHVHPHVPDLHHGHGHATDDREHEGPGA
jgi:drug/metabolite transporter (DMT)-like permease